MEVKVVAVGVGSRRYPVKIIVEDKDGNQFYQNVAMSKTNCGMRDDEFVADEAKYLFNNSFELMDDIMSISPRNYKQFIGKVVHTKIPVKMLNEVSSKQQAIPRLAEYNVMSITPHKNDDFCSVKLRNTTTGNFFYVEALLDHFKAQDLGKENEFFGAIFAPGPGKKVVTSEASRAMIRQGHVGLGMTGDEVEMAAGEANYIEYSDGGMYYWVYERSNNKLLFVQFDGSGIVKKTSVADGPYGPGVNPETNKKGNGKKTKKSNAVKPDKGWLSGKGTPLE